MKVAEIVVGGIYSNNKGTQRKVLSFIARPYGGGGDPCWLRYEIVRGGNAGGEYANGRCNTVTVAVFARWAKMREFSILEQYNMGHKQRN